MIVARAMLVLLVAGSLALGSASAQGLSVASFQVDVTPPIGAPLCGGAVKPAQGVDDPLSARGVVLLTEGRQPIVLCAVDWVGIGNGGNTAWRDALAEAAGTDIARVAVHTLHQHDAPYCDFSVEELAEKQSLDGRMFDVAFARDCIKRTAEAVAEAVKTPIPITHVGIGQAEVEMVASNRRVLGPDGKVAHVRWTATKDPEVRAAPVGTIDPLTKVISLWNGDRPVVALTYYATHPQSHYGEGMVSADFVGMARSMREKALPGVACIHFNGAGGNIGAGKWNDGTPSNRPVLAERLAEGMRKAWEATRKAPIVASDVEWITKDVKLPPRKEVSEDYERKRLTNPDINDGERLQAAEEVTWLERCKSGPPITLALLKLGPACVLHMPGELFVEYQLAAQAFRPDAMVCMAAYGDYGPGYIGTKVAYEEGGYETGIYTSRTAPEVEDVLMTAMQELLRR